VYIHGRPFCVKERDNPFKALANRGVRADDVEEAEVLLKLEVLEEARRYGGRLLALDETAPEECGLAAKGELIHYWEEGVYGHVVWTPREMYELAKLELTHPLLYHRVPITDELAPAEPDFDRIVQHMTSAHTANANAVYVFNCALGRGRTTTGLCTAGLIWRAIANERQAVKWNVGSARVLTDGSDADYAWGEYAAVRSLAGRIPAGPDRKAFTDTVIDACAHMQNLRSDILHKKKTADNTSEKPKKRTEALATGCKYLERYLYLFLFEGYVCCNIDKTSSLYKAPPAGRAPATFKEWLDGVLGDTLYSILDNLNLD